MGGLIWRDFGPWYMLVMTGGLLGLAGLVYFWWQRFDDSQIREIYVRMMRMGYMMAGGFLSFIGFQLVRGF